MLELLEYGVFFAFLCLSSQQVRRFGHPTIGYVIVRRAYRNFHDGTVKVQLDPWSPGGCSKPFLWRSGIWSPGGAITISLCLQVTRLSCE